MAEIASSAAGFTQGQAEVRGTGPLPLGTLSCEAG